MATNFLNLDAIPSSTISARDKPSDRHGGSGKRPASAGARGGAAGRAAGGPDSRDRSRSRSASRGPAQGQQGGNKRGRDGQGKKNSKDGEEEIDPQRLAKYARGQSNTTKRVQDKKLRGSISRSEGQFDMASKAAARSEILLPAEAGSLEVEGLERTYKITQEELVDAVDVGVAKKALNLQLDMLGPYCNRFDRAGRFMMLGGRKGHIAVVDWNRYTVGAEFNVKETVRDVSFLHNPSLFAVAQKKYVYIYDKDGAEVHVLKKHVEPMALEYLPYHFLLASVGNAGYLKYQDVSTGDLVAEHRTKLGQCRVMCQNPYNAVVCLGHTNGTVTMWTPNMSTPIVKMLAQRSSVTAVQVDNSGRYLVTAGMDSKWKVWDVRTYKQLHEYFSYSPVYSLAVSQRGLVATGYGPHVQVWKDCFETKASAPYMSHDMPGRQITTVRFRPFDDILAVAHDEGLSSLIIPGAGEPNFDSYEANPYQTLKQRREAEVHQLLDKLPASSITLDPTLVGKVDRAAPAVRQQEAKEESKAQPKEVKEKQKTRGRSRTSRRMAKKQFNVMTAAKAKRREQLAKAKSEREAAATNGGIAPAPAPTTALDRFVKSK